MARWARAAMDRHQIQLFSPTLDDMIPADHPVRLFDEILRSLDWSVWESYYVLVHGQPPIHPRVLASVLLYGLSQGIRSSRRLEWATANAIDYMWLADGRRIDHSTICEFRKGRSRELKSLFREIGRVAIELGLMQLNLVALDGTKVRASSSRHATATAATIEQRLAALDEQIEAALAQWQQTDQRERELFETGGGYQRLPRELADLKRRQAQLQRALAKARTCSSKSKAVPVADPDATTVPNKEGGYAPNYVPTVVVDATAGLIAAADVLADADESEALTPAIAQVEENFEEAPAVVVADSGFYSGPGLEAMQDKQVEALIPAASRVDPPDNPARREDPSVPVPVEKWDRLPIDRSTGRIGRTAFRYDPQQDVYYCPMGKVLNFRRKTEKARRKGLRPVRQYTCACSVCPLMNRCLKKGATQRTLDRDRYEPLREQMDERLRSESGRVRYSLRRSLAEGPIGVLKQVLGLRQFLLRGLSNVRTEWTWAASAFNLRRIIKHLAALRDATADPALP